MMAASTDMRLEDNICNASSGKDKAVKKEVRNSKELLSLESCKDGIVRHPLLILNKKKSPSKPGSTFRPPPSSVLAQARSFLPAMAKADCDLKKRLAELPPGALDIENVADYDGPLIEMNISLMKTDAGSSDSESDTETSTSDSSDTDDDIPAYGEVTEATLKVTDAGKKKSNGRPLIEEVSDSKITPQTDKEEG